MKRFLSAVLAIVMIASLATGFTVSSTAKVLSGDDVLEVAMATTAPDVTDGVRDSVYTKIFDMTGSEAMSWVTDDATGTSELKPNDHFPVGFNSEATRYDKEQNPNREDSEWYNTRIQGYAAWDSTAVYLYLYITGMGELNNNTRTGTETWQADGIQLAVAVPGRSYQTVEYGFFLRDGKLSAYRFVEAGLSLTTKRYGYSETNAPEGVLKQLDNGDVVLEMKLDSRALGITNAQMTQYNQNGTLIPFNLTVNMNDETAAANTFCGFQVGTGIFNESAPSHAGVAQSCKIKLGDAATHVHTPGAWEVTKKMTCLEAGHEVQKCTECGEILNERDIAIDHESQPGDWETVVAPTHTTEGSAEQRCTVCGVLLGTKVLPKLESEGQVVFNEDGTITFEVDGKPIAKGLVEYEGSYYFFNSSLKAVKNTWYAFNDTMSNGLLPAGRYFFGEDGKLQILNGIVKDSAGNVSYYENNKPVAKGLVKDTDGSYYFINATLKAVKNTWYSFNATYANGLLPAGRYYFGEDGKMQINEGLVVDSNGDIRYYENNQPVAKGLVKDENGNYYFINGTLKAVKDTWYSFSEAYANGLLPAGKYYFDKDGKLELKEGLSFDSDGEIRYYENGVPVVKGLVKDSDGYYYFINGTKKAVKNTWYAFNEKFSNGLMAAGRYYFDENGRMERHKLTLVADGASDYTIIVPASSWGKDNQTAEGAEYQSALDLQTYIAKMTGVTIPVKKDSDVAITDNEKVISVGMTDREGVSYTVDRDAIGEDGYTIKTSGDTLYIAGGRPRGTGYAVYDFLEKYFGCKFLTTDSKVIPTYETLTLDTIDDFTYVPAYWYRFIGSSNYIKTAADGSAANANGVYYTPVYGGRVGYAYRTGDWRFVHTLNHMINIDPHYYEKSTYECPECHTEYDEDDYVPNSDPKVKWKRAAKSTECPTCGKATLRDFTDHIYNVNGDDIANYIGSSLEPSGKVRFQPCITGINPITGRNVVDEAKEGALRWLNESAAAGHVNDKLISVSQYDTSWQYGGCECETCQAMEKLYGAASGNWVWLLNQVADYIKDDYPDMKVTTISYLYTNDAPTGIKARDNVVIQICSNDFCYAHPFGECGKSLRYDGIQTMSERYAKWKEVSDHLLSYDYYRSNGDARWIYPIQYQMYENTKWLRSQGIEGTYSYMLSEKDNFGALNQYLAAKLMWNPDMTLNEYQALINEFCEGYYGGLEMAEVVKLYHEHSLSSGECWGMTTKDKLAIMPSSLKVDEAAEAYTYDDSFITKVDALFAAAFAKADSTQYERIELEYLDYLYYKLINYHDIKANFADITNCPLTSDEVDTLIYNTADNVINLLVKYNLEKIGFDGKNDTGNKIDLSDTGSINRMDYPDNW